MSFNLAKIQETKNIIILPSIIILTIISYGPQQDIVSKNDNINGPNTIFGAPILFLMCLVISLTNEECTLAKSSKRNNTVLSASSKSFFSVTSKMIGQYKILKCYINFVLYIHYQFPVHYFHLYFGLIETYHQNTFAVNKKDLKNLHWNKNVIFVEQEVEFLEVSFDQNLNIKF